MTARHNRSMLTPLLVFSVAASAAVLVIAGSQLSTAAQAAAEAQRDLSDCRQFLADDGRRAAAVESGLVGAAQVAAGDAQQISTAMGAHLHQAELAAGVPNLLSSFEPFAPQPIEGTDRQTMRVALRLEATTLESMTRYLHHLASADSSCKIQLIELSAPGGGSNAATPATGPTSTNPVETWVADVTLAFTFRDATARAR